MHLQRARDAQTKYEYGCDLRRVHPWSGVAHPIWGSAIATVRPGESTTPDAHDESETFIVISGTGRMHVGEERENLVAGDVVYIPKNAPHRFENLSREVPLVFISIYWDSPEARQRMQMLVSTGKDDV